MSSRPKKGRTTGDRDGQAEKNRSVARASSSNVAPQLGQQTEVGQGQTASRSDITAQLEKTRQELEESLHLTSHERCKKMHVAERARELDKFTTAPSTRESSPYSIDFTAGAGKWSYPNSAPDPGKYLTKDGTAQSEEARQGMVEQAHHMKSSYDVAIALQPKFKEKAK